MAGTFVKLSIEDAVATVIFDNPPLNVVTLGLTAELDAALDRIEADGAIRAVILTGAGDRAFCAGSDISEFHDMMVPGAVLEKKLNRQNAVFNRLDRLAKPTIAAVSGLAFGGGLEIALCCDLIVVERRARIALPEIKLGVFPSSGGPVRTARRVGEGRAKQLVLLGEPIGAETALAWGLVDRIAPDGGALAAATDLARMLAGRPAQALALAKQAVDLAFDYPFALAIQKSLQLSDKAFSSPEVREGVAAFLAKRQPDFRAIPLPAPANDIAKIGETE